MKTLLLHQMGNFQYRHLLHSVSKDLLHHDFQDSAKLLGLLISRQCRIVWEYFWRAFVGYARGRRPISNPSPDSERNEIAFPPSEIPFKKERGSNTVWQFPMPSGAETNEPNNASGDGALISRRIQTQSHSVWWLKCTQCWSAPEKETNPTKPRGSTT